MATQEGDSSSVARVRDRRRSRSREIEVEEHHPAPGVTAGDATEEQKLPTLEELDQEVVYEFGGPKGTFLIMIGSHLWLYFLWVALDREDGAIPLPASLYPTDVIDYLLGMVSYVLQNAMPTKMSLLIYGVFIVFQALFSAVLPGIWVEGLPLPSEKNRKLKYLCNGVAVWYTTLACYFVLHYFDIFPLSQIIDHLGPLLTTAMIFGDSLALLVDVSARLTGRTHRMSGNVVYDFFMGSCLNPRPFGDSLDLKMWMEIQVAWIWLFTLTLSAACKQYSLHGTITGPMIIMLTAHFLYTNACMKGEECIPTTWDIFYEKWGWMLIWWNNTGVPFAYCFQSVFLSRQMPFEFPTWYWVTLMAVLLLAYYTWDTANSQKNRFRMMREGTFVKRWTFPQLPWGTLDNPKTLKTKRGTELLIDGWYRYARKIHYTADLVMALVWGLSCGFTHVLPYFYPVFFLVMITHRCIRDFERCARKYGKDWDEYCRIVPYKFIPGIV